LAGLLKASFVPPQQVREWRDLFRYQRKATGHIAAEWNRILKVLEDANIKLSSVLTDISGVSGRQMLEALSRGQTNVDDLLKLAHGRLKAKRDELKKALVGKLTRHHQFMLTTLLRSIAQQEALIADINQQIDSQVAEWQEAVDLLQTIPGVGHHTAVGLLAEIGTNMEQFPSEKHLASWAGMAPGNHESAGKKKVHASPMAASI
jgi:transposase